MFKMYSYSIKIQIVANPVKTLSVKKTSLFTENFSVY